MLEICRVSCAHTSCISDAAIAILMQHANELNDRRAVDSCTLLSVISSLSPDDFMCCAATKLDFREVGCESQAVYHLCAGEEALPSGCRQLLQRQWLLFQAACGIRTFADQAMAARNV